MPNPKISIEAEQELQDLMVKVADGDRRAFEAFYDLSRKRIYGIALKILKEPELAEEATLDIYLKIWNQASHYKPEAGLVSVWSNIIARNRCLDYLRKRNRRDQVEMPYEPRLSEGADYETPEGLVFQVQRSNQLLKAMEGLGEEAKKLLMASFFHGLSHGEIAKTFNQPLGTVKTRIRKALAYLRVQLRKVQ